MPSLFRRLGRYAPSPLVNQAENRLTEGFAVALEHADGLAHTLARMWVEEAVDRAVPQDDRSGAAVALDGLLRRPRLAGVRSQRPTVNGKIVDLELRFAPEDPEDQAGEFVVWVEVKHGAGLHGTQLDDYLNDIRFVPAAERLVVLLAPRQAMPEGVPPNVVVTEWQQAARGVAQHGREADAGPVGGWLVKQFTDYLKRRH